MGRQSFQDFLRLIANLGIEIGKLRLQRPNARMVVQQRGRLVGNVGPQFHLPLEEALDQFGRQNFRHAVERAAVLQRLAHAVGGRLGGGAIGAHPRKLGRQFGELLGREHRIVAAHQEVGLRAIGGNLGLGLLHPILQIGDFRAEKASGGGVRFLLRIALGGKIGLGDGVRDLRGKLWVLRRELDRNNARLFNAVDVELIVHCLEHALFRRNVERIALQADKDEGARERRHLQRFVEFGQFLEVEVRRHPLEDIGRRYDLDLGGYRLLVGCRLVVIG